MTTVILIENLWKEYRLGVIGHGTLTKDLQSWWARVRGKEDPNSKILLLKGQHKQIEGERLLALQDINLEVKKGEILAIIGKNGAGKSTLLKILARVTAPTRGTIKVRGRIASLLEVGTGFHQELTGKENVFLNGAILGMSKQEISAKLDEIIDFSGVEDFINTPVKRYSSGMYVRLAFAVAAHLEPEILVVDEVLAVGDAEFQQKCLGKMGEISREGRTVLFVSHQMTAVTNLCTKAVALEGGEICDIGEAKKVVDKYLSNILKVTKSKKLCNRSDRRGAGQIIWEDTWIERKNGFKVDTVSSGMDITIIAVYNVYDKDFSPDDLKVSIGIYNLKGEAVTNLATEFSGDIFRSPLPSTGRFECEIKKLPLTNGDYVYNLLLKERDIIQDNVLKAGILHVVGGDFHGSGRIPNAKFGFLTEHKWKLKRI